MNTNDTNNKFDPQKLRSAYESLFLPQPSLKSLIKSWENIVNFKCKNFKSPNKKGFRVKQNPYELARCLYFLHDKNINSYTEITKKSEGLFYLMSSFFSAIKGDHITGCCYDFRQHKNFDIYQKHNPWSSFVLLEKIDHFFLQYDSDLFMIDTPNTDLNKIKEIVNTIWNNGSTRFLLFHDIEDDRYNIRDYFKSLYLSQNGSYTCYRFYDEINDGPGLGLIEINKKQ